MTRWVGRLIGLNVLVYVVQISGALPVQELGFFHRALVLAPWWQEWRWVTYMFLHDQGNVTHILFNMFALWVFGPRVEARLGGARFLWLYFISGLTAPLVSMFLAPNAALVGASGAIFGVTLAYARFWPTDRLLIWGVLPVQARTLVILYTAYSLLAGFSGRLGTGIAHFAHLGGFLGGWLYLVWLERHGGAAQFRRQAQARPSGGGMGGLLAERDRSALARWARIPREQLHEVNRAEVDRILDKISAHGLGSLTPGERETLERFSPGE
ncbi:MAG TPA: rhomboid family intramembrane serine protease [Gemmatimonadales bacterium]|nr:rhomboid family intramembrane serine protease [Gemmatimonadales bacterium]